MSLTERDILRLQGVDADLVRVVKHAAGLIPLVVVCGLRTREEQAALREIKDNLRRVEDKLDRQAALTAPTDRTRR